MDPVSLFVENARISNHNERVAAETVLRYFAACNEVEKQFTAIDLFDDAYDELPIEEQPGEQLIAGLKQVHNRFWLPTDDEYWLPCSYSNEAKFSVNDIKSVEVRTDNRSEFLVSLEFKEGGERYNTMPVTYRLITADGTESGPLVIVNQYS